MTRKGFRCMTVVLPGFAGRERASRLSHYRFGYGFTTLADAIAKAIRENQGGDESPVTLVVHDWGSIIGFWVENRYPQLVQAMVAMDVGPMAWHFGRRPSLRDVPKMLALGLLYHFMLISLWLTSLLAPSLADRVMVLLVTKASLPVVRYSGSDLHAKCSAMCCYPYVYLWFDFVTELLCLKKPSGSETQLEEVPG
eukprot:6013691-Prymnesium_polylepis.1